LAGSGITRDRLEAFGRCGPLERVEGEAERLDRLDRRLVAGREVLPQLDRRLRHRVEARAALLRGKAPALQRLGADAGLGGDVVEGVADGENLPDEFFRGTGRRQEALRGELPERGAGRHRER
jgi:hypothetical protein